MTIQNQLGWKLTITILHFVALSATVIRVVHRLRSKRAWWDDYVVIMPWVLDFMFIVLFWTEYGTDKISWLVPQPNAFLFSYWFMCFICFTVIWASRISLSLSLARIFLPGHLFRKCALGFCGVLFFFYIAALLGSTLACGGSPWWQLELTKCSHFRGHRLGKIIVVLFIIDFTADVVLIAGPLYMLWNISLPRNLRVLILVLFSSSLMTLVASALYCGLYFRASHSGPDSRLLYTIMGHFQVSLSLLACNVLVVTMLVYNQVQKLREPSTQPADQPPIDTNMRSFATLTLTSISENTRYFSSTASISLDVPPNETINSNAWLAPNQPNTSL